MKLKQPLTVIAFYSVFLFCSALSPLYADTGTTSSGDFGAVSLSSTATESDQMNPPWLIRFMINVLRSAEGSRQLGPKVAAHCSGTGAERYVRTQLTLSANVTQWRYAFYSRQLQPRLLEVHRGLSEARAGFQTLRGECTDEIGTELENAIESLSDLMEQINRIN